MANWDVAFAVNDKRFYAHRSVLSLVSTYFEKMFAGGFREAREEVDPDVFEAFLHCVYPCGSDPPGMSMP
ncbi:hypothetical protein AAVH_21060 [Aphelenchoides avenae]|nr:hypothetical protein AAVH_21060 [Aphelenchus avenae]